MTVVRWSWATLKAVFAPRGRGDEGTGFYKPRERKRARQESFNGRALAVTSELGERVT